MNIPQYCKNFELFDNYQNVLGENWIYPIGLTLSTMVFLVALFYMASEFFREQKLKAWAKFELFQIFVNVVLLITMFGLLKWMCTYDVSSFYRWLNPKNAEEKIKDIADLCNLGTKENIITPYCSMQHYLDRVQNYGKVLYQILFITVYYISLLVKYSVGAHPIGMGFNIDPAAGFSQLLNLMTFAISGYTLTFISLYVQQKLIEFFLIAIPYYFIPIGILLRSFFATREFGGAVLGFSIASIFFYPFTFVLADIATSESYKPLEAQKIVNALESNENDPKLIDKTNELYQKSGGDPNKIFYLDTTNSSDVDDKKIIEQFSELQKAKDFSDYQRLGIFALNTLFSNKASAYRGFSLIFLSIQAAITLLNLGFSLAAKYFVAAGVFPLINFIVYIQATAFFSQLLGSRLDISNITRMI
ncbi:MAG: hypothetical protein QXV83_01800 [Candidatus Anstonellaceae archaeon]